MPLPRLLRYPPNDLLSQKRQWLRAYSTSDQIRRVLDSHQVPLFSRTRMRVSCFHSVAHLPQNKPGFPSSRPTDGGSLSQTPYPGSQSRYRCRQLPENGSVRRQFCHTASFGLFLLGSLLHSPLISKRFLPDFLLSVFFFLPFCFFLNPCKGLTLVCCPWCRESRQGQGPVPGTKPLLNAASSHYLTGPGSVVQPDCTAAQIGQKLRLRICPVLLPEFLLLLVQGFLDHSVNDRLVYILSSGICHDFFLSKQKLRQ